MISNYTPPDKLQQAKLDTEYFASIELALVSCFLLGLFITLNVPFIFVFIFFTLMLIFLSYAIVEIHFELQKHFCNYKILLKQKQKEAIKWIKLS